MRPHAAGRLLLVAVALAIFLPGEAVPPGASRPEAVPGIVPPGRAPAAPPGVGANASPSRSTAIAAGRSAVASRAPGAPRPGLPSVPAAIRARAVAAARAASHLRAPFERRSRSTGRVLRALQTADVMRIEPPGLLASSRGHVVHDTYRLYKDGLPVFNRTGRVHRRDDRVFAQTGKLGIPPLAAGSASLSAAQAIGAALAVVPGRGQRAPPESERGWLATPQGTLPIWQVTLAMADPLGTWLVRVDARDGDVLSADDLIRTATGSGLLYPENAVTTPVPAVVSLFDLDGGGFLQGRVTQVFDVRELEAYRPDGVFDFGTTDPRFVQTSVYRGLTDAARYAEAHGLTPLDQRVLAFTNLFGGPGDEQFNNAYYDPFFPIFGFGNGDGTITANLGTDVDVAIHEMGHHVFAELVDPTGSSTLQSAAALNEGFADTLAALVNDDPEIGESTIPGQPFLRSLDNTAVWPDDTDLDPHVEGLIYGGLDWDLRNVLGNDLAADIVIASLPFLDPDDDFPAQAYREALLQGGQVVNGGATNATIGALADARGIVARDELDFQGYLDEGSPVTESLLDEEFRVYLFSEFPGSRRVTFTMTGTGDADLLVAPVSLFDPNDPSTYFFPGLNGSNETVSVTGSTHPSVNDDDLWLVVVQDYPNGQPSSAQLSVSSLLPLPSISAGGSYAGTIAQGGDIEFITFLGAAGQIVRLEAHALSESLDVAVAIFDPRTIEIYGADDDSGEGTDSLIQGALLPEAKAYGIAIFSLVADVDPTIGAGDFRLDLSLCPNTGPDSDGDGLADECDDDDDDDTFVDSNDSAPLDPLLCQDIEGDGCDDCVSGSFAPFDDGPNADGDHLCDAGDPDDDNDGCEDGVDPYPFSPSVDDDVDFVGSDCDNCPETFNPGQVDFDQDGLGDACDPTPMPEPNAGLLGAMAIGVAAWLRGRRAGAGSGS